MKKYLRTFGLVASAIMQICSTVTFITYAITQEHGFFNLALYFEALAIYFKVEG